MRTLTQTTKKDIADNEMIALQQEYNRLQIDYESKKADLTKSLLQLQDQVLLEKDNLSKSIEERDSISLEVQDLRENALKPINEANLALEEREQALNLKLKEVSAKELELSQKENSLNLRDQQTMVTEQEIARRLDILSKNEKSLQNGKSALEIDVSTKSKGIQNIEIANNDKTAELTKWEERLKLEAFSLNRRELFNRDLSQQIAKDKRLVMDKRTAFEETYKEVGWTNN